MKKYSSFKFSIIFLFVLFCFSCNNKLKNRIIVAERIEYDASIINNDKDADWWVKNIEGSKRDAFLKCIIKELESGKLKLTDYLTGQELSSIALKNNLEKILKTIKIKFREKWYIDKNTAEITKMVLAFCPVVEVDSADIPLFWINTDTTEVNSEIFQATEKIQYDVELTGTTGKEKWYEDNIEASKRTNLIKIIIDAAYSGKVSLFDNLNDKITVDGLKKQYDNTDTLTSISDNPPYDVQKKIIHHQIDKNNIVRLRFSEEWLIGGTKFCFTKKIQGISPILKCFTEQGELKGYMPLYWIYFGDNKPKKNITFAP